MVEVEVLLSIKPEYAEKIFSGEKKYEFRRISFNLSVNKVVVYASKPVQKIVGEFEVERIITQNIDDLWESTGHQSCVDKEFYCKYFSGKKLGHAIKVKNPKSYDKYRNLQDYDVKCPPQSFIYLTNKKTKNAN